MGHAIALRREGIPTSPVLFVPFLGAVIGMRGRPAERLDRGEGRARRPAARLGRARSACCCSATRTARTLLEAAAFTGFFLNLFNLLPIVPLDGGRAAAALHPLAWIVGIAGLAGLAIWHPNPILFLFLVIGGMEAWTRLRVWRRGAPEHGRVLRGDTRASARSWPSRTSGSRARSSWAWPTRTCRCRADDDVGTGGAGSSTAPFGSFAPLPTSKTMSSGM